MDKLLVTTSNFKIFYVFSGLNTKMVHCIKIYGRRRKAIKEILLAIRIKIEYSFLVFDIEKLCH